MTITAEERSRIAKENGKKSQGPRTESGKNRSRTNALKDGLRAKTIPLPHEDQEAVSCLAGEWEEFVGPTDPAMRHLTSDCVRANLLAERCDQYRQGELEKQGEAATRNFKRRQRARLKRCQRNLPLDPGETLQELYDFALGVRWLGDCFEQAVASIEERGYLLQEVHDVVVRLYGVQPTPVGVRADVPAYYLSLYSYGCMPGETAAGRLAALLEPAGRPAELRGTAREELALAGPEAYREHLAYLLEDVLRTTREEEEQVRQERDDPALNSALREAAILEEPAARRHARSQSEAHRTFHRAWKELKPLMAARKEKEESKVPSSEFDETQLWADEEPETAGTEAETAAPGVAPNEPTPMEPIASDITSSDEPVVRTSIPSTTLAVATAGEPAAPLAQAAGPGAGEAPAREENAEADELPTVAPNEPTAATASDDLAGSCIASKRMTPSVETGYPAPAERGAGMVEPSSRVPGPIGVAEDEADADPESQLVIRPWEKTDIDALYARMLAYEIARRSTDSDGLSPPAARPPT